MKSYGPKRDIEPTRLAVVEGLIVAIVVAEFVKGHVTLNPGGYWIIAAGAFALFVVAFMASSITRVAAMVVVTPFIVFVAYALGTSMVGFPVGIVLGIVALKLSMALHLMTESESEVTKIVRKVESLLIGLFIAIAGISAAWYHFHPPTNVPSRISPVEDSPTNDTSQ